MLTTDRKTAHWMPLITQLNSSLVYWLLLT